MESSGAKPVVVLDAPLHPIFQDQLEAKFQVVLLRDFLALEPEDQKALMVQGIFSFLHDAIDAKVMDACLPSLKVVSNFGAGYDHVDVKAATSRGIPCGHTPGCLSETVSVMTWALILGSARNVVLGDHMARDKSIEHWNPNWFGIDLAGATLGILGLGEIGQAIAAKAAAFHMPVIYHKRIRLSPAKEAKAGDAEYVDTLEGLLVRSDFLVLALSLSEETKHIIGARELAMMKRTSTLINIARGGVLDQDALVEALRQKTIRGAALDVTDPEPLDRGHPLLAEDLRSSLLLTPHIGSATFDTRQRMMDMAMANLQCGIAGNPLPTRAS